MLAMARFRARDVWYFILFFAVSGWLPGQVRFEIRGENGETGGAIVAGLNQTINPTVFIVNPTGDSVPKIQGFQMAISHDPEFLTAQVNSITWRGTALDTVDLLNGDGPDFFYPREIRTGQPLVSQGITLGVIFEEELPSFFLGEGEWEVAKLSYRAIQSTPKGSPTSIGFAAELGDPPIANKYNEMDGGFTFAAETAGMDVDIGGELNYTIAFPYSKINTEPSASITVPIMITNSPRDVDGFSLGVKHDGNALELVDVQLADGLTSILGGDPDPQVFSLDMDPENGPGFTMAIIFSVDENKVLDSSKSPHHVLDVIYQVKIQEGTTKVQITDQLGKPAVAVLLDLFGTPQKPLPPSQNPPSVTLDVEVIPGGRPFIRGDVNPLYGRITLLDALGIIQFLLGTSEIDPPLYQPVADNCMIAFNVDGSTTGGEETQQDLDLTDVIYLLGYLFLDGPPPPAPFSNFGRECAPFDGPASPRMTCAQFSCP